MNRPEQIRPEQIRIDRIPVANAEFWLTMTARWLADPDHADQFDAAQDDLETGCRR